jgi:hypothetical protein
MPSAVRHTDSSNRARRPVLHDLAAAFGMTLLLQSAFGRRRVREVVPEILSPDGASSPTQPPSVVERIEDALQVNRAVVPADVEERPHPQEREPEQLESDAVDIVEPEPPRILPTPSLVGTVEWACEIAVWRGYRKAVFYGRAYADEQEVVVAESTSFRARGKGTLERTDEASAAHERLCRLLEGAGWGHSGHGDDWYSDVFRCEIRVSEEPEPAQTPP